MNRLVYILFCAFLIPFYFVGCVEPFDAETQVFEEDLVIDARLTDEIKKHEILLSRARPFEVDAINTESNASVLIEDDSGQEFVFEEVDPGRYVSILAFGAQQNKVYRLLVTTADGELYASKTVETPTSGNIEALYAARTTNDSGEEGVSILIDAIASENDIGYFRYEYEETYKIIAPFWNPFDFVVIDSLFQRTDLGDYDGFEVGIKPKEKEERVCYNSNTSKDILQSSSKGLNEGTLNTFAIRFLNRNNYIISHRYSIVVRQYTQTQDAFGYYQRLNDFSSSESVFSEIQPGFLQGNIFARNNKEEKVLGYFEVTSVNSERLYFNYADLFSNEPLPPFAINCEPVQQQPIFSPTMPPSSPLIDAIRNGLVKYHATNEGNALIPYKGKDRRCGDCTSWGSNVKPDFWVE